MTTDMTSVRVDETLARFRELQTQFERVRDRLRRAEEQKNTVSRRTFDKVRAEYDRELDALRAKMSPLRDELESHRTSVEGGLKDANASLESIEEELAEVDFRARVGEYSETEIDEKRRQLEVRLADARARISEKRRTLDMFDAMQEPEAPAQPEHYADSPAVSSRETITPAPSLRTPAESLRAPAESLRAPAESLRAPLHSDEPIVRDEPQPVRRPVLRAATPETPPPSSRDEAIAHAPRAEAKVAPPAPKGDFENPHDWIKEMGRDNTGTRRLTPTPASATPARPRLGASPAPSTASPARGVAPASRTPSLVFVNGPHAGESVPLLPTTLTVGREHDNNVELKDPDVARYHARIVHERGNYVVEDLDSTTGTWVNGQRTKRVSLNHGDVVRVGSTEIAIDFEWASDPV